MRTMRVRAMNPFSLVIALTSTNTTASGINSAGIFNSIWTLVNSFLTEIVNDLGTFINEMIVQALGQSFVTIFSNWGYAVSNEGIWAPLIGILVLALSGYAIYAFLDLYGIERDVLHGEEDV